MDYPIWTKIGCGADAIIELINNGMDLTQREPFKNQTVLHFRDLADYCFAELQNRYKLDEIFDIIFATLENLLSRSDLRENKAARGMIGRVVEQLIDVFSCLNTDSSEIRTKEIIKTSLDLIGSATEFYELKSCNLIRLVRNLHHLPRLLLNIDAIEYLSQVRD